MRWTTITLCLLLIAGPPGCTSSGGSLPVGMIAMFDGDCPDGWTRFEQLDGRFPRGNDIPGDAGGEVDHTHTFDITARTSKDGMHHHMLARGENTEADSGLFGHVGIYKGYVQAFEEGGRDRTRVPRARAVTDDDGAHDHLISVQGDSEPASHQPPYLDVVFCRKD